MMARILSLNVYVLWMAFVATVVAQKTTINSYEVEYAAKDAPLARAFCASSDFKRLSCKSNGIMNMVEYKAIFTKANQCRGCGVRYMPVPTAPATVTPIGSSAFAYDFVSLACKDPILVRAVFKPLSSSAEWCSAFSLSPNTFAEEGRPDSPTIRCELQLPPGSGDEEERALRAKEINCHVCGACWKQPPVRCAWTVGKWYSVAEGCELNPQGYFAHTVGFKMSPGVKVRLAKFEVCEPGSCFNPAYEAAKQASAKTCTALSDQPGKNDWKCN